MQQCDYHRHCRFDGGVIRPGETRVIIRGRVAHLACAISAHRRLRTYREHTQLTEEQRQRVDRAIAEIEFASMEMDLSSSGSVRLDLDRILDGTLPQHENKQPSPAAYLN